MSDMISRAEARKQTERITMNALAALPKQAFGELREPEAASRIWNLIGRIVDNEAVRNAVYAGSENRQYDERLFRSFLSRAYNLMGVMSEEEVQEAEARSMAD